MVGRDEVLLKIMVVPGSMGGGVREGTWGEAGKRGEGEGRDLLCIAQGSGKSGICLT